MAMWFYLADGHEIGPHTSAALKQLADSGRLKPNGKVRREDLAKWYLAKQVKGLFLDGQIGAAPASSRKVAPRAPATKRNVTPPQSNLSEVEMPSDLTRGLKRSAIKKTQSGSGQFASCQIRSA